MSEQNKPYVLIVEDEAPLVTLLRYNLEKQGFRVEDAGDGGEALTRITEAPPELLLLDWMLPTMSGIELCRQLRRRPATRALPIIMLTARAEDSDAVRGLDTGADDYITKPFSTEALIARIRALLRRSGSIPTKLKLNFHDISLDPASHRVLRNGRIPPPRIFPPPSQARLFARGRPERRMGQGHPRRTPHRRRSHSPASQSHQRPRRARYRPHRPRRRLRPGH
jgi:CheY-like chemotaxis protein